MKVLLLVICMTVAIMYTYSFVGKIVSKNSVHWLNMLIPALGWTGVITYFMGLW